MRGLFLLGDSSLFCGSVGAKIRNSAELHWDIHYLLYDLVPVILIILGSEAVIDYAKHIFILRWVTESSIWGNLAHAVLLTVLRLMLEQLQQY